MDKRLHRVLILDTDPDTLITLQRVLEDAEFDVTITWDETEAFQLLGTASFHFIILGDHLPELDAAGIIEALSFRGTCPSVLIVRTIVHEKDINYFRWLGAIGVVSKRDTLAVLNQVRKTLAPRQFKPRAANAGSVGTRSWLTALGRSRRSGQ